MINTDQSIPCPVCNAKIPFDTNQLLSGIRFICPKCTAAIGLSTESKEVVQDTMNRLQELKSKMSEQKNK